MKFDEAIEVIKERIKGHKEIIRAYSRKQAEAPHHYISICFLEAAIKLLKEAEK